MVTRALLDWHNYKYFPYEYKFGIREIKGILPDSKILRKNNRVIIKGNFLPQTLKKLAYFSQIHSNTNFFLTDQARLENSQNIGKISKRQSTRYSVHGLHDYKGKFNPQVVRSLLNILSIKNHQKILDPFCGSGTTLVECAQMNINSCGFDINPLAVYITNAKLKALSIPARTLKKTGEEIILQFKIQLQKKNFEKDTEREIYLKKWFPSETLALLEALNNAIKLKGKSHKNIFYCVASNLLRDYSLQEPADLRIRRRRTPLPKAVFIDAFSSSLQNILFSLTQREKIFGKIKQENIAYNIDSREITSLKKTNSKISFDAIITSPPYVTALPYIDTQRLSLVWLNLIKPKEIYTLDASLVGSRETNGQNKEQLLNNLLDNRYLIPKKLWKFCLKLNHTINENDGFRRKAVPYLLYRYLSTMSDIFKNIYQITNFDSPFAMIVGNNQTTLGGKLFDIPTTSFLILLAKHNGWNLEENTKLQTFKRFGLQKQNSVRTENLIVVRKK